MELIGEKILAALFITALSLFFGFLPKFLSKRFNLSMPDSTDTLVNKKQRKNPRNVIMSFFLNLGGGVLIANSLCHMLPEVKEGIEHENIETWLPLAEVVMCLGFFFISALEEVLHHYLQPLQSREKELELDQIKTSNDAEKKLPNDEIEDERITKQIKAKLRTFFVVTALSFHSIIAGMASGLEEESAGVWLNTAAIAMHKFVLAFCVGGELINNKVSVATSIICIVVFSFAPAFGSAIGIILTEISYNTEQLDLPIQILQGIATGTIVYVVFFEIIPKAKTTGGTGTQHILALLLGFAIFLPSIYLDQD